MSKASYSMQIVYPHTFFRKSPKFSFFYVVNFEHERFRFACYFFKKHSFQNFRYFHIIPSQKSSFPSSEQIPAYPAELLCRLRGMYRKIFSFRDFDPFAHKTSIIRTKKLIFEPPPQDRYMSWGDLLTAQNPDFRTWKCVFLDANRSKSWDIFFFSFKLHPKWYQ